NYSENDKYVDIFVKSLRDDFIGDKKYIDDDGYSQINIYNDRNSLALFITQFIFNSTSTHELIGNNIVKYVYDPRAFSSKIRWNKKVEDMYPDEDTYNQALVIAIATSITKLPRLTDDISFIFENDNKNKEILSRFYSRMNQLINLIDERNLKRTKA